MMNLLFQTLAAAALLGLAGQAGAQATQAQQQGPQAGYRTLTVPGDTPIQVALFYPTAVPARALPMGPWQPVVAPGAPAAQAPLKGLVLISHGTGGSEVGHHHLATRLARDGYLVAALRHPGDNWEDRSMVTSGRYFSERPRQVSRVLDALLASPEWGSRIPAGRIGAVGHSAGGYTVLALAGAEAEPQRAAEHCRSVQDDPMFCSLGKLPATGPLPAALATPAAAPGRDAQRVSVPDPRIRAIVALAPLAVVFTPESLAAVAVPVRVIVAERDTVLVGKYHGGRVAEHMPKAQASTAVGAGHFAFMAQPSMPLPSDAGDAAANPPGFDRVAYQPQLEKEVVEFFAQQWR